MNDSIEMHFKNEITVAMLAPNSISTAMFMGDLNYLPYKQPKYWPQYKRRNWLRFFWWPIMIVLGIIGFAIAAFLGAMAVEYGGSAGILISAEFGIILAIMEWQLFDKWESMPTYFLSDPIRMRSAELESVKYQENEQESI